MLPFRRTVIYKGGESFSFSAKQKFISRLIKEAKETGNFDQQLSEINFSSNQFSERIIKKRNILAHAHPEYDAETGKITLISSIENADFDEDWFHKTRENIHEHKNKFRKLMALNLYEVVNPALDEVVS